METIRVLIVGVVSFMYVMQITPLTTTRDATKVNYFGKGHALESMSAFFKLIPDRLTKTDQKRLDASRQPRKALKSDAAIKSAKPMIHELSSCKHVDYLKKFSYFINVPVMHPFEKYKIIVVPAPPYIKFGAGGTEPLVVYMIFNDDTTEGSKTPSMPEVYFITQQKGRVDLQMKSSNDQIWVINSNRTVTGLKSKNVAKFVDFRTKLRQPWARSMGRK